MSTKLLANDRQTVLQIVSRGVGMPPEKLTGDAQLTADLGADSLTLIEISMAVEEKFGLNFSDERLESIKTVDDLCVAVAEALSSKSCPG